MASNKRSNANKYDSSQTAILYKVMSLPPWEITTDPAIKSIKKAIYQGADPHVLLERFPLHPARKHQDSMLFYQTPLEMLAFLGEGEILRHIFDRGIRPTPPVLWQALYGVVDDRDDWQHHHSLHTFNVILHADPELIHTINDSGNSILIEAIIHGADNNFIESLLKHGANPDIQSEDGSTALMYVAKLTNDLELIGLLLEYGADEDLQDKDGHTYFNFVSNNNGNNNNGNYNNNNNGNYINNHNGGKRRIRSKAKTRKSKSKRKSHTQKKKRSNIM